ncbi:hypothetical protein TrRE_jg9642 [Triparma retinervis]|uniref:Carboxypeptidase n=1 Tax=Triparma retinervis TaxID=2557542 RepID=A0A9W7CFX7_9STRA|nr:hypothetical protein TrRE_jg9642 [Triparma retinervis]
MLSCRGLFGFATTPIFKSSRALSASSLEDLVEEVATTRRLEQVSELLHWDSMVTMPQTDGHHAARGVQSQALAGVIHERSTSPKIGALIAAVDEKCLEGKELANFRLMVKAYKESCVIPKDLERRKAQVSSDAYVAWTKAREASDFDLFSPLLGEAFSGRSDVSVHPFTTSFSPSDVRITTRFDEGEWYQGLAGSVHEAGHGMYEANLDGECRAVNSPLSMGTHESQSLFWERHVGMSRAFSKFMGPKWREAFGREESDEEIYRAVNTVKRSLIRVEADELTYPLHVILRTRIERDVVNGKVSVGDIPALWNSGMKAMLDVDVPEDSKGCLQDVHWSGLAIGYFPTYLIGAVAAAQLEHHARMELGNFDELIERGEFDAIQAWLRGKVHRHGSEHSSIDELFKEQLGEELKSSYFIKYLTDKYSSIYDL